MRLLIYTKYTLYTLKQLNAIVFKNKIESASLGLGFS
jgi:hypothetical protein